MKSFSNDVEPRSKLTSANETALGEGASDRSVLLIEDNPAWRRIIKAAVQKLNPRITVQTVNSAEEFIRLTIATSDFDLIISDHFLGGEISGLELWRILEKEKNQTPFLLTSAIGEDHFLSLTQNDARHPHFVEKALAGGFFSFRVQGLLELSA
jgi:CheY-like chemotaxis protein